MSACILKIAQNLIVQIQIFFFAKECKSLPKDRCQNFCNSIVLRDLKLPGKGAKFRRKMVNFVKFTKAILGPEKQSPGPKSIKINQNLPRGGRRWRPPRGTRRAGVLS